MKLGITSSAIRTMCLQCEAFKGRGKLNILLVNINIGKSWVWGGIESHTETLASLLASRGHKVIMGCWNEGKVTVAERFVLPSTRITVRNSGDILAILRLVQACRREDIEVVIANCGREFWPVAIAAGLLGAKVILVRHQLDRIRKTTRWLIANHVDRVIAVSRAVEDVLVKSGVPPQKLEVIHNSVPLEKFNSALIDSYDIRKELGLKRDNVLVGTVGKIHRGKGVYELLRALDMLAGKYPMLKLLYVGEGPEMSELQILAAKPSLEGKVIFAGVRRDIERMYAAMDIFALPSHNEGLPTVLLEAMAMGKPVIGTMVGGIPEVIEKDVNGILIPPQNDRAIAEAITRYLEDDEFRGRISSAGRRTIEQSFSDVAMGNKFEEVLRGIVCV